MCQHRQDLASGKLKLWCPHFGLLPSLMWPIMVYDMVRLNMTLTESQEDMIQGAPRLATGRKYEAIQQAKSALRHGDIV